MGLFSFFRSKRNRPSGSTSELPLESYAKSYMPLFWEDDYLQVEIVPAENTPFLQKQAEQIAALTEKNRADYGFTDIFLRNGQPVSTLSKEIRVEYLQTLLSGFQFQRARHIQYVGCGEDKILDGLNAHTRAFGFPNFTLFFDIKEEFVNNIWILMTPPGIPSDQLDLIEWALYSLGEEINMVLIDWNRLELIDLANKLQIRTYLLDYWKE